VYPYTSGCHTVLRLRAYCVESTFFVAFNFFLHVPVGRGSVRRVTKGIPVVSSVNDIKLIPIGVWLESVHRVTEDILVAPAVNDSS
jgi:hypothetical protein